MADRGRRQSGSNDMDRSRSGSFRRSMRRRSRSLQSSAASETDEMDEWGKTKSDRAQLITEFKTILAADNIYDDKKHDDHMLLRYLRARKYNLQLAKAMWKDSLEWRREFGTDTILEDFDFHERKEFLQVYPQGYHMTDKKGRPIYIQHLGAINLPKIEQVTTIERMVKFHVQEYERCIKEIMPACSAAAGRHIDQSFVILDVKGVGPRLLTGNVRKVITSITKIDQDNYPEMLGKTCIINAPTVFRMVWAVVRSMLDPRTVSKIEICGTNYLPTLRKYCAAENLPKYLGGLSSATLIDDVGPWNRKPAPEYGLDALHEAGEDSASVHESGPFSVQDLKESQKLKVEQLGLQGDGGLPGPMPISLPGKRRSSRGTPLQEKRKSSLKSPRRTIAERLQALEAAVPLQSEKLRQHLPAQSAALAAPPTPGTPSGSVLGRLEALEQAMVVLLAAQDAQLAERQGAEKESGPAAVQQQGRESPAVQHGSRTSSRRASEVGVVEQPPLEQASWGCMPCSVM